MALTRDERSDSEISDAEESQEELYSSFSHSPRSRHTCRSHHTGCSSHLGRVGSRKSPELRSTFTIGGPDDDGLSDSDDNDDDLHGGRCCLASVKRQHFKEAYAHADTDMHMQPTKSTTVPKGLVNGSAPESQAYQRSRIT
ncbi:unnamed protein product [Protopolystoma xenopodis]|uniref:Uncharacterized protein n=1 Tax=Protopolystoma xenopodis TaxID=117903 RepID=A0A448WI68_9PLAT|nr:unnamed protein product [Protopolystoma xenopodis]